MKHYIIVKWNNTVTNKSSVANRVRRLFTAADQIEGIEKVQIKENITPRDNRYDLMIILDMVEDALQTWDDSSLHKRWKAEYGDLIEKKVIFDSAE